MPIKKTHQIKSDGFCVLPSISVFPNPVNDFACIKSVSRRVDEIRIADVSGKEVYKTQAWFIDGVFRIDLPFLAKGYYYIIILSEDKKESFPLLKISGE